MSIVKKGSSLTKQSAILYLLLTNRYILVFPLKITLLID